MVAGGCARALSLYTRCPPVPQCLPRHRVPVHVPPVFCDSQQIYCNFLAAFCREGTRKFTCSGPCGAAFVVQTLDMAGAVFVDKLCPPRSFLGGALGKARGPGQPWLSWLNPRSARSRRPVLTPALPGAGHEALTHAGPSAKTFGLIRQMESLVNTTAMTYCFRRTIMAQGWSNAGLYC